MKLFYHKANLEPTSSASENLKSIQYLMNKKDLKIGEKVSYSFKQFEFPETD